MERVLAAGLLAMVISILVGPKFIDFLRRNEMGQHIREEGPEGHRVKQGTPTMGGLLLVFSATVAFLALSHYTTEGLAVFGVMLGCAAVGFADDYTKLRHRRSLGLAGRWKLLLLAAITVGLALAVEEVNAPSELYVPVVDWRFGISLAFYLLLFLIIAGAANGANLTDGIDGLAAGIGIIALLTFAAMNVVAYTRSGQFQAEQDLASLDMAILAAALIGGTIGFLWYNAFPAEVHMGDTGSFALGGAIAGFAIVTGTEILLPLIAGIFVIEVLSLIIQVVSFKRTGRRVFLIAPIHHHFEMKAWSETKIMVRFWIVCAIFCASGFALFYRDFLQFVSP